MWPLCHPSALQRSGKQASLTESSLEPSLAQQASHRGWEAGRKCQDSFPWVPKARRTPECGPMGWDPWWSHTNLQEPKVRK